MKTSVFTYSFWWTYNIYFFKQTEVEYRNSGKLTAQLTPLFKKQNKQYSVRKTQIKIAKQVIKKEKADQCYTSGDQLRINLSEKSNRLLEISIVKDVSNRLRVLPIGGFSFELLKQYFWDAICLRYGWSFTNLPATFPCSSKFSIQHCMNCQKGGFVFIKNNDLREISLQKCSLKFGETTNLSQT